MGFEWIPKSKIARFILALAILGVATFILVAVRDSINSTTVALGLLLVVLTTATFMGRNPALLSAFGAMLCFNYYFIPPIQTWQIADSQNLVAWAAFTITAVIGGELSAYARRRASESRRLYSELQVAFESATQAEASRQSEKLKSALLDAVTHDLRTPLTSIKASVTTLIDSEGGHRTIELDDNGRLEFLQIIDEETDRLNRFIDGIVELAKLEARPLAGAVAAVDLEEIVSETLSRAKSLKAAHRIVVEIESDLPKIQVNSRAIGEVLYNLIDNSIKFSASDTIIWIIGSSSGENVTLSVIDEGKGIPNEMRERVFEKYFRIDERSNGLGLGLAIARGIVESQGGSIRVDDSVVGTKVVVTLPAVDDE